MYLLLDIIGLIGALTISIILASFVIIVIAMSTQFQRWYQKRVQKAMLIFTEEVENEEEA